MATGDQRMVSGDRRMVCPMTGGSRLAVAAGN
jgi:hypothetical protein